MRRRSKRLAGAGSGDEEALLGAAAVGPVMSAVERLIAHRIRALLATLCVPRIQDRSKHVQDRKPISEK